MTETRPKAVTVLVDNHRQFLAFLERRIENPFDAEDILQTAFVKSIEKGDSIRNDESVVTWFYRLLRNALVDYYRHKATEDRAHKRIKFESPEFEEPDLDVENAVCQCVLRLISILNEDYARLIQRVDLEGASISDVAAETGLTPNNVRVKLHRARAALRRQLEVSCGTCAEHGCLDCACGKPRRRHD